MMERDGLESSRDSVSDMQTLLSKSMNDYNVDLTSRTNGSVVETATAYDAEEQLIKL